MINLKKPVRKIIRFLGYDIVKIRSTSEEDSFLDLQQRRLPKIPILEVESVKNILRDYVARYGKEPGQYKTFESAAAYLNYTRMQKQWGTVEFAANHGVFSFDHGRILDVGSGTGYLLRIINRFAPNKDLVGFDPSPKSNSLGPMMCPTALFTGNLDWKTESPFDCIFCTQVLEHLVDPDSFLQNLYSILSVGGSLVLTVPNGRYDYMEARQFNEKNGAYTGHVNFWSPESWQHWLEKRFSTEQVITEWNRYIGNLAIIKK